MGSFAGTKSPRICHGEPLARERSRETLRRHRLTDRALRSETFYPFLWTETAQFYGPADLVEARLTEWTLAIHLWSTSSLLATPEVAKSATGTTALWELDCW